MKAVLALGLGATVLGLPSSHAAAQTARPPAPYEIALSGLSRMRPDESQPRPIAPVQGILLPNSWSPDGRTIAMVGRSGLVLVDVATGRAHTIVDTMRVEPFFAWSPDAKRIAFSSMVESAAPDSTAPSQRRMPESAISIVDVTTGESRQMSPPGQNRFVSWSADGTRVAYAGTEPGGAKYDIYVLDVALGNIRRIVSTPTTVNVQPSWSPRGDEIAYVAAPLPSAPGNESGVFIVRGDGTAPRHVSKALAQSVTWSPDGRLVLVRSASNPIVDAATGATKAEIGSAMDATFTPDGTSIVYRDINPPPGGIFIVDVDGNNRRKLADASFFAVSPLLPPNGPPAKQ